MADDERSLQDLERELSLLLRRARALSGGLSREIHPDLDAAAYSSLATVTDVGPLRANDLSDLFGVDKSSISRQVQRLEQQGFLDRRADDTDRRAQLLVVTPTGKRRLTAASKARRVRFRARLDSWDAAEVTDLARLLHRLNAALD